MDILQTIITACGGALVTGIIALLKDRRALKNKDKEKDDHIKDGLKELKADIKDVSQDLKDHIALDKATKADEARTRILHFGDEVKRNIGHTQEHWKDVLRDIDRYNHHCKGHPEYINSQAILTISFLEERYSIHLLNNDFLN